jgi:hypothetical protein
MPLARQIGRMLDMRLAAPASRSLLCSLPTAHDHHALSSAVKSLVAERSSPPYTGKPSKLSTTSPPQLCQTLLLTKGVV